MPSPFSHPLFVVAGFSRTGTTSLYKNLEAHPGFLTPVRKELNHFVQDAPIEDYLANFTAWREGQICVDVSGRYALDVTSAARLHAAAPQARVIIQIREPVSWILSVYDQVVSHEVRRETFAEFLEKPWLPGGKRYFRFSLDGGVYAPAVAAFSKLFGDQLMLMDHRAFVADPVLALQKVEAFAGAAPYFNEQTADSRAHNSNAMSTRYPGFVRNLMSRDAVISTAVALIPAPVLRQVRKWMYYDSGNAAKRQRVAHSADEIELARTATAADQKTYAELFAHSPIRFGSEFQQAAMACE